MDELLTLLGVQESSEQFQRFRQEHLAHAVRSVANDVRLIHYESAGDGVEVQLSPDGVVKTIFLYVRPRRDIRQYRGSLLPDWLSKGTKTDVRLVCGQPERSGSAPQRNPDAKVSSWDLFRLLRGTLHVEYDDTDHTSLITLMRDSDRSGKKGRPARDDNHSRVTRFADAHPGPGMTIVFVPSLISLLTTMEKRKGAPLTRQEVLKIRDNAAVVTIPKSASNIAEQGRGYRDIDPDHVWEEWLLPKKGQAS